MSKNMERNVAVFSFILCALLALTSEARATGQDLPDCEIDRGPCSKGMGQITITIDITPKPVRAMEELTFTVWVKGGDPRDAVISLSMPGMYMGKNKVIMKRNPDRTYSGKGVIPKCPSGKNLWRATVEMPDTGEINFTFNVTR